MKLSRGLNLPKTGFNLKITYNFKWNQPYLSRVYNLSRGSNSLNSASELFKYENFQITFDLLPLIYSYRRIYKYNKDDFQFNLNFYKAYNSTWIYINLKTKKGCKLTFSLCLLVNLKFEKKHVRSFYLQRTVNKRKRTKQILYSRLILCV